MGRTTALLVLAATMELAGDAAIRNGLVKSGWPWLAVGAVLLAGYGFFVNSNRDIAFGRTMGLYIAVFFAVSQLLSAIFFAERPSFGVLAGGTLIVMGGVLMVLLD